MHVFGLLMSSWVCSTYKNLENRLILNVLNFLYCKESDVFGLLASSAEAYGFMLVCAFVCLLVTAYLEKPASDFNHFLHKAAS